MAYGITDLPTFVLGTILIVLLPGPNSLYVMTVASRHGIAAGYRSAAGVFTGDLILMSLTFMGAASLLQNHHALFVGLKFAGAVYLAYVGGTLLRAGFKQWRSSGAVPVAPGPPAAGKPYRMSLLISVMNPKAILFYLSFFIQFVSPSSPRPGLSFLILGAIVQACSMAYLSAVILGGHYLVGVFRKQRHLAALCTGGAGVLFIAFGVKLATAGIA